MSGSTFELEWRSVQGVRGAVQCRTSPLSIAPTGPSGPGNPKELLTLRRARRLLGISDTSGSYKALRLKLARFRASHRRSNLWMAGHLRSAHD